MQPRMEREAEILMRTLNEHMVQYNRPWLSLIFTVLPSVHDPKSDYSHDVTVQPARRLHGQRFNIAQ